MVDFSPIMRTAHALRVAGLTGRDDFSVATASNNCGLIGY
jgi:hypothetical protein